MDLGQTSSSPLTRLGAGDLRVGAPIPWRVYDAAGRLLLRDGHVFSSEEPIEALLGQAVYRGGPRDAVNGPRRGLAHEHDPFEHLERATAALADGLGLLARGESPDASAWVAPLIASVQMLNRTDADALLGALRLMEELNYSTAHPWLTATLCDRMAYRAGLPDGERLRLVAAALTSNAGLFEIQDVLSNQASALDVHQRRVVEMHPLRGRELLVAGGVRDALWLQIVAQHHERADGSGYPQRLAGQEGALPIRLLALADLYAALVLPRNYRDALHDHELIKAVFEVRGSTVDGTGLALFGKEIEPYPPGAFVRLVNGETGVVIRRNPRHADMPVVSVLWDPHDQRCNRPIARDTASDASLAIDALVSRRRVPFPLTTVWGIER